MDRIERVIEVLYSEDSPWKSQPDIEDVNGKKEYFWRHIHEDDAIEKLRNCSEVKEIVSNDYLTKFHGFGFEVTVHSDGIMAKKI